MDLESLRRQHSEKTRLLRAIVTVAQEEKRELAPDEELKFANLQTELSDLVRQIKMEEIIRKNEDVASRSITPPVGVEIVDTEERGQVYGQPKRFRSFGEQMQAVMRASIRPNNIDSRLLETRAVSGLNEGLPSDGGFLVQTDFATELLKRAYETGQVASRCRRIGISGNANSLKINGIDETSRADGSRWGGVRAYWTAEAGDKSNATPSFRQIELSLTKLTGLAYATDELLQDAGALESVLMTAFSEEFGFKLDDAIINGDGSGKPLGILASSALVSVAKEAGQPADTIQPENLIKIWSRCWARSRINSVWFINQDIEPQLFTLGIAVGTGGGTVYMPPGGLSSQPYGTLFGRPVIPIEQCQTLGDKGDIILADMSQYILADKGGVQSASSIHVRFVNDESVFRFVYRVAGQPIWHSALTPFTGAANTLSPFVTLNARA
jgi:HK97 family phage major capsid protein